MPPAHIRPKLDFGYRIEGQSLELFEIRPFFRDESQKIESPIAKTTFVKSSGIWKVYWQRADLKWHRYEPVSDVETVKDFLKLVEEDEYCCFFG